MQSITADLIFRVFGFVLKVLAQDD